MGLAQSSGEPVALVCTSGTAAVNLYPAVVESYYQHIPLIVMTADRPSEWIDQGDGQTIHQENLYGSHVKSFINMPVGSALDYHHESIAHEIASIIRIASQPLKGPVHINVPIEEPFYQDIGETSAQNLPDIQPHSEKSIHPVILPDMADFQKILIVIGQLDPNKKLKKRVKKLAANRNVAIIAECHSNLQHIPGIIDYHDIIFGMIDDDSSTRLTPDLLVTMGESIVSKTMKTCIRKWNIPNHWHVQEAGNPADVFQSITDKIYGSPEDVIEQLVDERILEKINYRADWELCIKDAEKQIARAMTDFNEISLTKTIIDHLPETTVFHIGNSMPVRWVNMVGVKKDITVFSNRGTSGIDGVMSTAMGHALYSDQLHVILIGDMSFFYDRNAFWHSQIPENLRVIIYNNNGGGIFGLIDGPSLLPECNEFLITKQELTAKNTAKDFNLDYILIKDESDLMERIEPFFSRKGPSKIMEVFTDTNKNLEALHRIKER